MVVERFYTRLNLPYSREAKDAPNSIKGFGQNKFLSNFYPISFEFDSKTFCCSEQAYMWHKSEDYLYREALLAETNPGRIKRLGRNVELNPNWENVKYRVMYEVLSAKFKVPSMSQALIDTKLAYLEESNWWGDVTWGVCSKTGHGHNHLGRILMCIRQKLINQL